MLCARWPLFAGLMSLAIASACSSGDEADGGGLPTAAAGRGGSGHGASGGTGGSIALGGSGGTGNRPGSGGSIGLGGAAGSGTSGSSNGGACTGTSATGQKGAPPTLLFLLDTSRSMNDVVGGRSKLVTTQGALDQSFQDLDAALRVGLVLFPHVGIGAMPCFDATVEVPIAALDAAQRTSLANVVDTATADGSTPTHDAFAFAVKTLQATSAAGPKYIVLITDGQPTYALGCMGSGLPNPPTPTQPLIDATAAAYTAGIKTFVVGSPGSEPARSALSAMARVGGTGTSGCSDTGPTYCHFDMTMTDDFAGALADALGTIGEQVPVDCTFDLPRPPAGMTLDLDAVNVTVTHDDGSKTPIGRDPSGDCATDGWRYVGEPPTGVELCGATCAAVKAEAAPAIDVQFGCTQRVNPPR